MRWQRIIHFGLLSALLAGPALLHGQEPPQDADSLKLENQDLRKERSALEARVRQLQHELDGVRTAMVQAQAELDASERRCRKLQDELIQIRTVKAVDQPADDTSATGGRPAIGKPKPGPAHGKITAVGKDGRLVQISIGADAGIKEGQALEVYRQAKGAQRPLYLGAMTLIRVDPEAALGEFKSVSGLDYRPGVGDEVATELVVK